MEEMDILNLPSFPAYTFSEGHKRCLLCERIFEGEFVEHFKTCVRSERVFDLIEPRRKHDIVDKLLDLQRQATTEHSHYYVARCITEAIQEIVRLRGEVAK